MPRLDSGSAACARSGVVSGSGAAEQAIAGIGNPGVAEFLLQVAHERARALSRARSVYSVDEAEEHATTLEGRRIDHAPGTGILLSWTRDIRPYGLKEIREWQRRLRRQRIVRKRWTPP